MCNDPPNGLLSGLSCSESQEKKKMLKLASAQLPTPAKVDYCHLRIEIIQLSDASQTHSHLLHTRRQRKMDAERGEQVCLCLEKAARDMKMT